jgi:hypothetical protein
VYMYVCMYVLVGICILCTCVYWHSSQCNKMHDQGGHCGGVHVHTCVSAHEGISINTYIYIFMVQSDRHLTLE